jgi:hypothetical protein
LQEKTPIFFLTLVASEVLQKVAIFNVKKKPLQQISLEVIRYPLQIAPEAYLWQRSSGNWQSFYKYELSANIRKKVNFKVENKEATESFKNYQRLFS